MAKRKAAEENQPGKPAPAPVSDHAQAVKDIIQGDTHVMDQTTAANKLVEPILQFFAFEHLPEDLQKWSKPFCELAQRVAEFWPRNAERTVTLRKLLEAKDAAVRSQLAK